MLQIFYKLLEILISEKSSYFSNTPGEFYSWKMYRLEDIMKTWLIMVTIIKLHSKVWVIANYVISFYILTFQPIKLKFETNIYWVMTHHLNKYVACSSETGNKSFSCNSAILLSVLCFVINNCFWWKIKSVLSCQRHQTDLRFNTYHQQCRLLWSVILN